MRRRIRRNSGGMTNARRISSIPPHPSRRLKEKEGGGIELRPPFPALRRHRRNSGGMVAEWRDRVWPDAAPRFAAAPKAAKRALRILATRSQPAKLAR